jgi:phage protein D
LEFQEKVSDLMASAFRLLMNGTPADDAFYTQLTSLEVEENADLPGAIQLSLPVDRSDSGDLTFVADDRLKPFANLAVVATPEGGADQCIFDGFVLTHKLHLQRGTTASTLQVWGQDASWLMNLEEKVKEWADVTDANVANAIFADYGISPSADNTEDDSPSHTEDGHSLMQRASDIQFLRTLARRNGKLCRVACTDTPGQRTGYFAKPSLDGDPVVTLTLNDPVAWTVDALDFDWDVTRPTSVKARQALFNDSDEDGVSADTTDSGLSLLDAQGLSDFSGQTMTVLLTAPVDDAQELSLRAQSLLREADWFARCQGEADVARLNAILRVGTVVVINGAGSLNSGKYFVWSVRHTITADSHKMKFTLVRNAMGPPPSGAGLGGLLGGL